MSLAESLHLSSKAASIINDPRLREAGERCNARVLDMWESFCRGKVQPSYWRVKASNLRTP